MQLMIFGGLTFGLLIAASLVGVSIVAQYQPYELHAGELTMKANDYARPELAGVVKGLLIANSLAIFVLPPLWFFLIWLILIRWFISD